MGSFCNGIEYVLISLGGVRSEGLNPPTILQNFYPPLECTIFTFEMDSIKKRKLSLKERKFTHCDNQAEVSISKKADISAKCHDTSPKVSSEHPRLGDIR